MGFQHARAMIYYYMGQYLVLVHAGTGPFRQVHLPTCNGMEGSRKNRQENLRIEPTANR